MIAKMPKKALIVYNPSSVTQVGPEDWLGEIVHRICYQGGYQVRVIATEPHMRHDSLSADEITSHDLIVAAGGDGTIRLVLGTLAHLKSQIPAAIMPLGTGNQLARNLGVYHDHLLTDPLDDALDIALNGVPMPIDLGLMNDEYFCVAAGAGPMSDAVIIPSRHEKATWKMLAYMSSMIQTFALPPVIFKLNVDGEAFKVTASGLFITNIADLGVGTLSESAVLDDGLLDLCVLNPRQFKDYLTLGFRFAGGFVGGKAPYYIRKVRSVDVEVHPIASRLSSVQQLGQKIRGLVKREVATSPLYLKVIAMIDGDPCGTTPMHVEVVPKAVNVLVAKRNGLPQFTTRSDQ
jgi:diacylglycerol kinase (ATP)